MFFSLRLERANGFVRLDLRILAVDAFVGKIHADKPCHQHGNIKLSHNRLEIGDCAGDRLCGRDVAITYCSDGDKTVIHEF